MADEYSQSVVRLVVAQICKNTGFDSINSSALEVLVDFAERHISQIGRRSRRYAEQFGRADPSVDDLEMVFRDIGISPKDVIEYTKNVEPMKLSQTVPEYPVESQAKVELFIPELDDDGKIVVPSDTPAPTEPVPVSSSSVLDSPAVGSRQPLTVSPLRAANRNIRLTEGVENTKFRMRTQLMMEDGELSSLFSQGKPPSRGRPPRPLHEINVPKLKAEPTSKPKIKTGILKPKPKAPPVVDVPEVEIPAVVERVEEIIPASLVKREKHKPPKKVQKKKKKVAAVIPPAEGFSDIFGATLEKPVVKAKSKAAKVERRPVAKLDDIAVEPRSSSSASQAKEETMYESGASDRTPTPDLSTPAFKARNKVYDDTIDAVLASARFEMVKSEAAEQAFSFDDRPVTPVGSLKTSLKSPSKKSRSPARSHSPASKSSKRSHCDDTIDAVARGGGSSPAADSPMDVGDMSNVSPSGSSNSAKNRQEKEKEKKKKRSRREKLLERFAAAPIPFAEVSPAEQVVSSPTLADVVEDIKPDPEPPVVDEPIVSPAFEDDEEAELVNVDEDSDVDILEASSPTPPPQNPYSAYSSTGYEEASSHLSPPFNPALEPMIYEERRVSYNEPEEDQWTSYQPEHHPAMQWEGGNSQTIDFGSTPQHTEEIVRKEKHKKEKKEKKEKKKKKHKEKDREKKHEDGGKHKHKKDKSLAHVPDNVEEEFAEDTVPRLKLKIGAQAMEDVDDAPALDSSYNTMDEYQSVDLVPRLVIKPITDTPAYGAYPETAGFAPALAQQAFPATTDYGEPSVDLGDDGKIWICPTCKRVDDGSPMIGCDGCDEWYHWTCVGITIQPPDDVEWFCATCSKKKKDKKKKRKKDKR